MLGIELLKQVTNHKNKINYHKQRIAIEMLKQTIKPLNLNSLQSN